MSSGVCAACRRSIDAAAKVCPYCGADPSTGERIDTQALMQELFQPKTLTRSESVLEYARQRQGVVMRISVAVVVLLLAAAHSFVTALNARERRLTSRRRAETSRTIRRSDRFLSPVERSLRQRGHRALARAPRPQSR